MCFARMFVRDGREETNGLIFEIAAQAPQPHSSLSQTPLRRQSVIHAMIQPTTQAGCVPDTLRSGRVNFTWPVAPVDDPDGSLSLGRSRSPPCGWAFGELPSSESRHHGRGARESFIAVWPAYCCAQPAVPLAILGSIVSLASTNPSGTVFLKYLMQIELTQCRSSVGVCFSP